MDATEAQLRFGASLTQNADPAHPGHPLHSTTGLGLASSGTGNTSSSRGHRAVSSSGSGSSGGTRIVGFTTGGVDGSRSRPEREGMFK